MNTLWFTKRWLTARLIPKAIVGFPAEVCESE